MSIPTSLIVVVLVLAWLVVLLPMVARRREAVPEAEMAGGTFRVLQRSGGVARRRPSFGRRSPADVDDLPEGAVDEQVSGNQELDEELLDDEYDDIDEYDSDDYDNAAYGSDDEERDGYRSRDDRFDAEQNDVWTVSGGAAPGATAVADRRYAGSHPYRPDEMPSAGSHPYRPAAVPAPVEAGRPVDPADHDDYSVSVDHRDSARYQDSTRYEDEALGDEAYSSHSQSVPTEHEGDLHLRPIPRRAGRGGYDPDAAEVARQFKYSRRRRVTVVLLLATLLFSVAAVLINPVLWAGTAVFALLLIGYLAYLRRQVQVEANIRERRLARLRRARQIRPEYDLDRPDRPITGSSFGRREVPASQVPSTGYRRGREIVDLDDGDPAFEDLEYYQPLTYRRAAGQ